MISTVFPSYGVIKVNEMCAFSFCLSRNVLLFLFFFFLASGAKLNWNSAYLM